MTKKRDFFFFFCYYSADLNLNYYLIQLTFFSYILFFFYISYAASNSVWNETDIDILKTSLLKDYDTHIRPDNSKTATVLWVGITVLHMEVVESTSTLETHAWLKMNWTDSKMKWDPAKFNGISSLRLSADDVI